eukprot:2749484-Alexandrium_andersonii.AAC.1
MATPHPKPAQRSQRQSSTDQVESSRPPTRRAHRARACAGPPWANQLTAQARAAQPLSLIHI